MARASVDTRAGRRMCLHGGGRGDAPPTGGASSHERGRHRFGARRVTARAQVPVWPMVEGRQSHLVALMVTVPVPNWFSSNTGLMVGVFETLKQR